MHKNILLVFVLFALVLPLQAQLSYGFKTGLNFSTLKGPSETDASGKNLENWDNITGFHIGATFSYPFSNRFGLRGELLYSKKGGKYRFEGPSYRFFTTTSNQRILTTGTSRYLINLNNGYFDIPVMAYGRFGNFEISGGAYAAIMVQSVAEGSLVYEGRRSVGGGGVDVIKGEFNLDYNYRNSILKVKPLKCPKTSAPIMTILRTRATSITHLTMG
jgi:Outer membrane protein beta-barrel domain